MMKKKGMIHIYTGNGKGKTTAALGLVFRASGHGMRSIILQFMKGQNTGEQKAAEKLRNFITIEQYGSKEFYKPESSDYIIHRGFAKKGYDRALACIASDAFDMVVLDEIFGTFNNGLISYEEILALIDAKHDNVELIFTGRDAPSDLFERCDLVTEMNEIKHYHSEGVGAREGVEF
jgi:cob(I)alamin adenosyltransferase